MTFGIITAALAATSLAPSSLAAAQDAPAPCDAAPAQSFVGGPATAETGAQILTATGARIFQWVFEGDFVTTDYRPERVRVTYDREMTIISVRCG